MALQWKKKRVDPKTTIPFQKEDGTTIMVAKDNTEHCKQRGADLKGRAESARSSRKGVGWEVGSVIQAKTIVFRGPTTKSEQGPSDNGIHIAKRVT